MALNDIITPAERRTIDQIAYTAERSIHPMRHFIGFHPKDRAKNCRPGFDQRPAVVRAALVRMGFKVSGYNPTYGRATVTKA